MTAVRLGLTILVSIASFVPLETEVCCEKSA
jgi:hypothetical protein